MIRPVIDGLQSSMVRPFEPDLVSTIIPVFNRGGMLREAVGSVLAQTYRPIEMIIIDDGSTDDTPQVCTELEAANPGVVRVRCRSNGGPGLARETGRQAARGEFLQYLDSDDLLHPRKFEMQVAALRERPECGAAYCYTRYYRIGEAAFAGPWKGSGRTVDRMFPSFLIERWWDTPNPLYRRSVCDDAGPWTDLRLEEDWEYDCRIAAMGTRLVHCRTFLVDVRDHGGSRLCRGESLDPGRLAHRARAHILVFGHARRGGIGSDDPHMRRFARELFLLARQCGAVGLEWESASLFGLAREASGKRGFGADFRLYRAAAGLLSWSVVGRWACRLDDWRSKP